MIGARNMRHHRGPSVASLPAKIGRHALPHGHSILRLLITSSLPTHHSPLTTRQDRDSMDNGHIIDTWTPTNSSCKSSRPSCCSSVSVSACIGRSSPLKPHPQTPGQAILSTTRRPNSACSHAVRPCNLVHHFWPPLRPSICSTRRSPESGQTPLTGQD